MTIDLKFSYVLLLTKSLFALDVKMKAWKGFSQFSVFQQGINLCLLLRRHLAKVAQPKDVTVVEFKVNQKLKGGKK